MQFLACALAVVIAIVLMRFGITLLRADAVEAEKNASRTRNWRDAICGRVQIHNDWLPDARVQGGMVYNKSANRIEICGRLSNESLERTFR